MVCINYISASLRINNLRNNAIQSEEIIFILHMWQRGSLSEHNDSQIVTYWLQIVMSWAPSAFFLRNAKQARLVHLAHQRLSVLAIIVMPGQIEILSQG